MSDGLDLQSSGAQLCSCLSATIKNTEAFDFSSSSITHLALYALFLLLAPLHPGWHQYNWGGGLNLCILPLPHPFHPPVLLQENGKNCKVLYTLHSHKPELDVFQFPRSVIKLILNLQFKPQLNPGVKLPVTAQCSSSEHKKTISPKNSVENLWLMLATAA